MVIESSPIVHRIVDILWASQGHLHDVYERNISGANSQRYPVASPKLSLRLRFESKGCPVRCSYTSRRLYKGNHRGQGEPSCC